jgi:hypothetical protein
MKFNELDVIVLDRDLPEHGLRKGDLGAVVHAYEPDWAGSGVRHGVGADAGLGDPESG